MAIWPFGRKAKRNTIQVDSATCGHLDLSQYARRSFDETKLGRKPSRKQSKRQKNRHSQPVEDYPTNLHDVSSPTHYPTSASQSELNRPVKAHTVHTFTTTAPDPSLSRSPSLRKPKRNESPATLKKRLSKRKAYEIAREREIRLLASMPIDIPRRATTPLPGDPMLVDGRRVNSALSRRLDKHRSDISLSIQESAASSVSDFSETFTFKVNSFAAWTPRPVIRYVEAPRTSYSRNQRTPEPAERKTKTPVVELSEENLRKQRIDELADNLDAGALRELMERDQRRRERKETESKEKLARKRQRNTKEHTIKGADSSDIPENETKDSADNQRGRSDPGNHHESRPTTPELPRPDETEALLSGDSRGQGSWLRDTSRDAERNGNQSSESVNVIGNIDDSSIREQKPGQRICFSRSQDMTMSRSTLSPSLAPSRHGLSSPDSSQFYNMTRESASDLSRTVDSERRISDYSGARANSIASIFRRGSSRLKRSYREHFRDRSPPPLNNVSNESFFKVHTQTQPPAPAPYVAPKVLPGPSSFKRSQSKFTEHFGDEPLSPPDSRLQSPDIPEHESEDLAVEGQVPDLQNCSYYPIPGSGTPAQDIPKHRHHSWTGDNLEDDPENLLLSQSLASIDSEGSWMSGQFLRRISQKPSNSARHSISSARNRTDEIPEKSPRCDEIPGDTQFISFGAFPGEEIGDSSNGTPNDQNKDLAGGPHQPAPAEETWHEDIAKRPVLVNPVVRPKSTEGLLNTVRPLSPISAQEEFSPIEENPAEGSFSNPHDTPNTHAHQQ